MAKVTWKHSLYLEKSCDIYSQQDFSFKNALVYAQGFRKYAGAIVPTHCTLQTLHMHGKDFQIFHAALPVEVNLTSCHKFLWSARHGDVTINALHPDTLEVFAVLTCIQRNQAYVKQGNMLYEEKVCDIMFPGSWSLALWKRYLCLWYKQTPLLHAHPTIENGLLFAKHPNLDIVLNDINNFKGDDNLWMD